MQSQTNNNIDILSFISESSKIAQNQT